MDSEDGIPDQEDIFRIDSKEVKKIKPIGSGGFGRVYLGDYLGTEVAIKVIGNVGRDSHERDRLLVKREVSILKACRHPNIVTFMGVIEGSVPYDGPDDSSEDSSSMTDTTPTQNNTSDGPAHTPTEIVLEYCSRGDLRNFLKQPNTVISWKTRMTMAMDIARGMAYLHSKNIVFRDLKCKNFLLDQHHRIKITDFGLARHHSLNNRPRTMCGTDGFMAPEVILGLDYDGKADVFSYGMVLFEMITRKKVEKVIKRSPEDYFGVDSKRIKASGIIPDDCPPKILDLAFWCCEYDPSCRPNFIEIIQTLRKDPNRLKKKVSKNDLIITRNLEELVLNKDPFLKCPPSPEEAKRYEKQKTPRRSVLSGTLFQSP